MWEALEKGKPDRVKGLLEKGGINVNLPDFFGDTALHFALRTFYPYEDPTINPLVVAGWLRIKIVPPKKNIPNGVCDIILQYCNYYKWRQRVMALFKKGAKANKKDSHGCTPLHIAAENGDIDSCKVFSRGIQSRCQHRRKTLDLAQEKGYEEIATLFQEEIDKSQPFWDLSAYLP